MPRIRAIKHDLYLDEELAQLPVLCRYTFPGLWTLADREGRMEDRPARIKAQLFPYEPHIDMEAVLGQLASGGFLWRYAVDDVKYLQIRTFTKHQQVNARETDSRIPAPCPCAHINVRACTCIPVHARGEGKGREGNGITDLPPTPQGGDGGEATSKPTLVPKAQPGRRPHPLDEDQDIATPDVQQRAAEWLETYAAVHLRQRGSRYLTKPQRDFEPAVRLARAYTDVELAALTALYLDATGVGFDDKPRTPGHLAHVAPMLEERLKEVGQWPTAA
jgi:hypothetical protein